MTTFTALSILIGKKGAIKVKDNFTFFLHRWGPWAAPGNRSSDAAGSTRQVPVLPGDRLALTPAACPPAPALSAQSPHLRQDRFCCLEHGRDVGGGHHGGPTRPACSKWVTCGISLTRYQPRVAPFLLVKPGEALSASQDEPWGHASLDEPRSHAPAGRRCFHPDLLLLDSWWPRSSLDLRAAPDAPRPR